MAIKILDDPDVTVTKSELARYKADYARDYMMYAGTPPTLNQYILMRQRQQQQRSVIRPLSK